MSPETAKKALLIFMDQKDALVSAHKMRAGQAEQRVINYARHIYDHPALVPRDLIDKWAKRVFYGGEP